MSAPRFTVLMPTHYRPDTIGYAIRSVLNQTVGDFELLVVGDGATPETAAVVQSFTDPRIKWFDLPKAPGFGYSNRNFAMEQSRGELAVFCADDDVMLPDHLERLGGCFNDPQVKWAYSQALWVSTDGIAAPDLTNLESDDERATFGRGNSISGGSLMFRLSAVPTRRCWPEHVQSAGDWEQMKWLLREYGLSGMRRLAEPTFLHFTAGRKGNTRDSSFPLLAAWLAVADRADWWPSVLRPNLCGRPAQAVYLDLLESHPDHAGRLRAAARDICNRIALGALSPRWQVDPHLDVVGLQADLDATKRQLSNALSELAQTQGSLEAVKRENAAIRNSHGWRLLAPVRRLFEMLRRWRR